MQDEDDDKNLKIHSYSAAIEFADASIPLDENVMTDADLLHLAVLAYKEMHKIWQDKKLPFEHMPGAMGAFAYQNKIFFASSIRAPRQAIKLENVHDGTVRANMEDALTMGLGRHRYHGACAEVNGVQMIEDHAKDDEETHGGRVAIWVRPSDRAVGSEKNTAPCQWRSSSDEGYGCHNVLQAYEMEGIDTNAVPDPSKEDQWQFKVMPNWRLECPKNSIVPRWGFDLVVRQKL
ncbi:MAG: hypothetical protein Q9198_001373 [Flavoplaca austrocitrina]